MNRKNDYGNTKKDFDPLTYYKSHGSVAKQKKKVRKLDEFIPKYFEPASEESIERKRNPELDEAIKSLVAELKAKSFVEIKDVSSPKNYMANMGDAARRRGIHLRFSVSSDGSVFVRLAKKD